MQGKRRRHVDASLGTLLPGVLKQVAREHGPLFALQRRWRGIVGKALASHARPVSLRRGRLVIEVDRPGDGFVLTYQRPQLLARLRAATGGKVEEIVIRPGG